MKAALTQRRQREDYKETPKRENEDDFKNSSGKPYSLLQNLTSSESSLVNCISNYPMIYADSWETTRFPFQLHFRWWRSVFPQFPSVPLPIPRAVVFPRAGSSHPSPALSISSSALTASSTTPSLHPEGCSKAPRWPLDSEAWNQMLLAASGIKFDLVSMAHTALRDPPQLL